MVKWPSGGFDCCAVFKTQGNETTMLRDRGRSSNFSDILKVSKYKTTPKDHTQTITIALTTMAETSKTIQWHFTYRIKTNFWLS